MLSEGRCTSAPTTTSAATSSKKPRLELVRVDDFKIGRRLDHADETDAIGGHRFALHAAIGFAHEAVEPVVLEHVGRLRAVPHLDAIERRADARGATSDHEARLAAHAIDAMRSDDLDRLEQIRPLE